MRLIELSLQHVRGVEDRTVTFTPEGNQPRGIIIVEGPNEAGKTTLRDAFVALLTYKASSKHSDVKLLQSSGRDEAPVVTATFTLGANTFIYRKQFTKRPATELTITGPGARQLTGDEAHDHVVAALDETLDRGLWQALWLTQRELATQPDIDDARGLTRVLDAGANANAIGMIEHAVVDAARTHYATYFTEKTGQLRTELKQLDVAYDTAKAERDAVARQVEAIQNDSDERDRLEQELPRLNEQRAKAEADVASARALLDRITTLRQDLRVQTAELAAARSHRDTLLAKNAQQQRLTQEQQMRTERIGVLAEQHATYDQALTQLKTDLAAAEQARQAAQQARDDARHSRKQAEDALALRHAVDARDAIVKRYEQLTERERERAHIAQQLAENTLTADVWHELDRLQHAYDVARIQQQQAAPELAIETFDDVTVTLNGDSHTLAANSALAHTLTNDTSVTIANLARISITVPQNDTATTVATTKRALDDALDRHGVTDMTQAQTKRDARDALVAQKTNSDIAYQLLLGDDTKDTIAHAYALIDDTTDTSNLANSETLAAHLNAARDNELALERAYDTADATERSLREQYNVQAANATAAQTSLANEQAEQERISRELAAHTHAEQTAVVTQLDAANATVTALEQQQATLSQELANAGGDDADVIAANHEAVLNDVKAAVQQNERCREQLDATIALRGGDGLFERQQDLDAALLRLTTKRDTGLHQAAVAKRLYDTLEEHRAHAHSRYIAPLNDEILRFGRLLYGSSFDVELDDTLKIARRHLAGVWLDVEQLSAGAQEQLALLARLACARLLGDDGGVIFFDDALGHTDQERLERLGAVLRVAAEHTQLVVLTCDGDRFRHVGGATRIVL